MKLHVGDGMIILEYKGVRHFIKRKGNEFSFEVMSGTSHTLCDYILAVHGQTSLRTFEVYLKEFHSGKSVTGLLSSLGHLHPKMKVDYPVHAWTTSHIPHSSLFLENEDIAETFNTFMQNSSRCWLVGVEGHQVLKKCPTIWFGQPEKVTKFWKDRHQHKRTAWRSGRYRQRVARAVFPICPANDFSSHLRFLVPQKG